MLTGSQVWPGSYPSVPRRVVPAVKTLGEKSLCVELLQRFLKVKPFRVSGLDLQATYGKPHWSSF